MRIERLRVYGRALPDVGAKGRASWRRLLRQVYLVIRSAVLWIVSILHFFPVCTVLVILGMFIDPRKNDRPQRWFFRNVLRLAGVRFQVRYAPGFDPTRTSIFDENALEVALQVRERIAEREGAPHAIPSGGNGTLVIRATCPVSIHRT